MRALLGMASSGLLYRALRSIGNDSAAIDPDKHFKKMFKMRNAAKITGWQQGSASKSGLLKHRKKSGGHKLPRNIFLGILDMINPMMSFHGKYQGMLVSNETGPSLTFGGSATQWVDLNRVPTGSAGVSSLTGAAGTGWVNISDHMAAVNTIASASDVNGPGEAVYVKDKKNIYKMKCCSSQPAHFTVYYLTCKKACLYGPLAYMGNTNDDISVYNGTTASGQFQATNVDGTRPNYNEWTTPGTSGSAQYNFDIIAGSTTHEYKLSQDIGFNQFWNVIGTKKFMSHNQPVTFGFHQQGVKEYKYDDFIITDLTASGTAQQGIYEYLPGMIAIIVRFSGTLCQDSGTVQYASYSTFNVAVETTTDHEWRNKTTFAESTYKQVYYDDISTLGTAPIMTGIAVEAEPADPDGD